MRAYLPADHGEDVDKQETGKPVLNWGFSSRGRSQVEVKQTAVALQLVLTPNWEILFGAGG